MFIKVEDNEDKNLDELYAIGEKGVKDFFSGKFNLVEVYTQEEYNAFYYKAKEKDVVYSCSVHFRDFDASSWTPYNLFYFEINKKIDENYKHIVFYFDDKDMELIKRIMGKAARDSVNYFNKWPSKVEVWSKEETIQRIKESINPSASPTPEIRAKREKRLELLNTNLKDLRYEDFIDK